MLKSIVISELFTKARLNCDVRTFSIFMLGLFDLEVLFFEKLIVYRLCGYLHDLSMKEAKLLHAQNFNCFLGSAFITFLSYHALLNPIQQL